MIARVWHGTTLESKSDFFLKYIEKTGFKDCSSAEGNCGVYVLRELRDGIAHFLFISLWESFAAIRLFAGDDIERAVRLGNPQLDGANFF